MDIVFNVFVFSSVVVLLGYLLNRKLSSSSIQKTVWQTGILTILVFVAVSCTGQGNAISQLLSSHFLDPQKTASQKQEHNTEEHTSNESKITLQEIVIDGVPVDDPELITEYLEHLAALDLEGEKRYEESVIVDRHLAQEHEIPVPPRADANEVVLAPMVEKMKGQPEVELHDESEAGVISANINEQNRWIEKASLIFFSLWGIGTVVFLTRLLVGRLLLLLYCRRLSAASDATIESSVAEIAGILRHRRPIRILESNRSATPVALGMFRPTLIIPTRMIAELDPRQRDVMLAHEIAHLSSYDPAWTVAMDVLLAVLWWNPAVWYLKKQLNHVNEHYADDASLVVEDGPTSLAECLVDLGARLLQEKKVEWVNLEGIPMSGRNSRSRNFKSSLGQRVARLLSLNDRNHRQFAHPIRNSLKVCGSLLIVASVIVGQTWANPGSFYKGESTVSVFKNSWKKSLAGVAILSFIGSPTVNADDKKDDGKKKIVLELKEAKPAKAHKHEVEVEVKVDQKSKGDVNVFRFQGKKGGDGKAKWITLDKNHNVIIGKPHGDKKGIAYFVTDDKKGKGQARKVIRLHTSDDHKAHDHKAHEHKAHAHAVIKMLGDGKHEVIELSGSPEEIKKKIAIHFKKVTAHVVKIAKSGDKKQAAEANKKLIALKKALSGIHFEGGQGKARIQIGVGGDKKSHSIQKRIVIGKDGKFEGKLPAGVQVIRADQLKDGKLKLWLEQAAKSGDNKKARAILERIVIDRKGKFEGRLPAGVRVIRADQLKDGNIKMLLEKAAKSGDKEGVKKLIRIVEKNQKSSQARRPATQTRVRRTVRVQTTKNLEAEMKKIHEKIRHLQQAANSLKEAGLADKAKELLVTAEKLAVAAKKQAAQFQRAAAEKQREEAQKRRLQLESRGKAREAETRVRLRVRDEQRKRENDEKAESRVRATRAGSATRSQNRQSDVNAELLQVIRQLSKEMKELRKDVNNLKKKVDK